MIEIDGSYGEGGGQILRTSLTLSALTAKPFRIHSIRLGRSNPGLRAQHLSAVRALAEICSARVHGDEVGSTELTFEPSELKAGEYRFDIGTAGSTSLVIQTIFLPLAFSGLSSVTIKGGTHNPFSPCYEYLEWQWLPALERMGFRASLSLKRVGFYPQGGGGMRLRVRPRETLRPLVLTERGELRTVRGISAVGRLPLSIAERQRRRAERKLRRTGVTVEIETREVDSRSPGTYICLQARFQHWSATYFSLGAPRKPAEKVADEASTELLSFIESGAVVDHHLADQIILPASLIAGESRFTTNRITNHLLTNTYVIERFLPVETRIVGEKDSPGTITLRGSTDW